MQLEIINFVKRLYQIIPKRKKRVVINKIKIYIIYIVVLSIVA